MVTSQNTQAARVDRQRFGNGEFGAEVGNAGHAAERRRAIQVLLELSATSKDALGVLGEGVWTSRLVHGDRIVGPRPGLGGDGTEQIDRGRVPPSDVIGGSLNSAMFGMCGSGSPEATLTGPPNGPHADTLLVVACIFGRRGYGSLYGMVQKKLSTQRLDRALRLPLQASARLRSF